MENFKPWPKDFPGCDRNDTHVIYYLGEIKIRHDYQGWFQEYYEGDKHLDIIHADRIVRIDKPCDAQTASNLYNYVYNPIILSINCPIGVKFTYNDKGMPLYNLMAKIDSIDDSSYTIWFDQIPLKQLYYIRKQIQTYVDNLFFINGEKFLEYCVSLGANPETKDYN